MTFKVIQGHGQGHVKLSFNNDDFQNLSPPPFFNQSKKFQRFLILDQNIFLPPNQQRQSTEGTYSERLKVFNFPMLKYRQYHDTDDIEQF